MKIEIITDRQPFIDGKACVNGQILECSADEGKVMIANGFAIEVKPIKAALKNAVKGK